VAIAGKIEVVKTTSTPAMNTTQRNGIMQRWHIVQHELMPELRKEVGTPKLEQVIHTLEWDADGRVCSFDMVSMQAARA